MVPEGGCRGRRPIGWRGRRRNRSWAAGLPPERGDHTPRHRLPSVRSQGVWAREAHCRDGLGGRKTLVGREVGRENHRGAIPSRCAVHQSAPSRSELSFQEGDSLRDRGTAHILVLGLGWDVRGEQETSVGEARPSDIRNVLPLAECENGFDASGTQVGKQPRHVRRPGAAAESIWKNPIDVFQRPSQPSGSGAQVCVTAPPRLARAPGSDAKGYHGSIGARCGSSAVAPHRAASSDWPKGRRRCRDERSAARCRQDQSEWPPGRPRGRSTPRFQTQNQSGSEIFNGGER